MARIICCGEGMLELSRLGEGWRLGYGGDTLNTAIHFARLGNDVSYLTALGSDPFSDQLRQDWQDEGLDLSLVFTHPKRTAGLYAVTIDAGGERSFAYWRESSAARDMFELADIDLVRRAVTGCDLLYFSLISLAILPASGRAALTAFAATVREAGGLVAFDGNFRPKLWEKAGQAVAARDAAVRGADIGLPTLDDERALSGLEDAAAVAAHWQELGCTETLVKLGQHGCRLPDGQASAPADRLDPVDTSGAGDAFNAGYLDARLRGAEPEKAAAAGHALAGWTIMRPGAIPRRDA